MTTTPHAIDSREFCEDCEQESPHRVSVELRVGGESAADGRPSRAPYRVSACVACGATSRLRMGDP